MEWYLVVAALAAGVVAGGINVLAGSGSLITLPVLVMLGLPSPVANGTNRVGVVIQCFVGMETMRRGGKMPTENAVRLTVPVLLGALVGAGVASQIGVEATDLAIGLVMLGMLGVLLVEPKRWLSSEKAAALDYTKLAPILFVVGVYGGFIQAGVGVVLLATLVLGAGFDVVEGNGIKMLIALVFTLAALIVFAMTGRVHWGLGLLMGVGQAVGAYLAARFAVDVEDAPVWIRRLLIVVAAASAVRFLVGG